MCCLHSDKNEFSIRIFQFDDDKDNENFLFFISVCKDPSSEFHCSSGLCIAKTKVCDGFADCGENEDEESMLCASKNLNFNKYFISRKLIMEAGLDHQCSRAGVKKVNEGACSVYQC